MITQFADMLEMVNELLCLFALCPDVLATMLCCAVK